MKTKASESPTSCGWGKHYLIQAGMSFFKETLSYMFYLFLDLCLIFVWKVLELISFPVYLMIVVSLILGLVQSLEYEEIKAVTSFSSKKSYLMASNILTFNMSMFSQKSLAKGTLIICHVSLLLADNFSFCYFYFALFKASFSPSFPIIN